MLKVSLQLFGGIGADSGFGGKMNTNGSSNGPQRFIDLTKHYKNMTLHEFEAVIRPFKNEYIGVFDKNGKMIVAGTSGV